ncbi:MAG: ABC transporter substrate-binding protein [Thermodesulfobacteriota bacterium]|nr:ABC transporter substrate-binding protein [Thermodesulfobacteriota bacterium]
MKRVFVVMVLVGLFFCSSAYAEDGVTSDAIILGQSCALTGPAGDLGTKMRAGLEAYFARANEAGGVKGRKIRLISKDDGYEPDRAIQTTRELIEKDKVFLLIGEVGTPTSKAVVPIVERQKVPFFGPFTGAEFLRNPFKKYVINVRGSYYQEMERLAQYLVDQKGLKKVACFYQNDSYGQAGLNGIKQALERRQMELVATGTYERNTVAIKGGLLNIRKAKPDAVVMVGAYKPCAEFIKLAKKVGMKEVIYCNISFVGTGSLKKELGAAGEGCIISQVVSFPYDESILLVAEYNDAIKKHQPGAAPGFVSLEGYMVGKLFCMAAEAVKGELTREGLIRAISDTGTFDLGGVVLTYGPNDHQGMDQVFLTVIKGGQIKPLGG